MKAYLGRDDKFREIVCRLIMFAVLCGIADFFGGGFTFVEGMIFWLFTGSNYDTTIILNNQRWQDQSRRNKLTL